MNKKISLFFYLLTFSITVFSQVNNMVGKWKTIDDKDGSVKSIVTIFKSNNGKYYGKVEKLFKNPTRKCTECEGANKDKPILGMLIINGLTEKNKNLGGGTILDPTNGKVYHCTMSFDANSGNLIVRGSLDKMGIMGRSQTWIREK